MTGRTRYAPATYYPPLRCRLVVRCWCGYPPNPTSIPPRNTGTFLADIMTRRPQLIDIAQAGTFLWLRDVWGA